MIELGVNIDHVATLRQVRGTAYPDPVKAAVLAERAGADAITLHLREDRRHIQDSDVLALRQVLRTRMNLESAVTEEMIAFACEVRPRDVCLVPERRQELTTEGGLDVVSRVSEIRLAVARLAAADIRVSLFVDALEDQIRAARAAGAPVIELHTGTYAEAADEAGRTAELGRLREAARLAAKLGLKVNAGHGLHFGNVAEIAAIPEIGELNIGHALVAEAIFMGWENAVREMKSRMLAARKE